MSTPEQLYYELMTDSHTDAIARLTAITNESGGLLLATIDLLGQVKALTAKLAEVERDKQHYLIELGYQESLAKHVTPLRHALAASEAMVQALEEAASEYRHRLACKLGLNHSYYGSIQNTSHTKLDIIHALDEVEADIARAALSQDGVKGWEHKDE